MWKGPLFTKKHPHFPLFTKNTLIFHLFFYKKTPPFHFLPTGLVTTSGPCTCRVRGSGQLVDERQLHGAQPAVDVDVQAPSQAHQLLALGRRGRGTSKHHLKPISYSRWAAEAEAPVVDSTASSSHCLMLDRARQYHWMESSCDHRHRFICEQDHA